MELNQKESKEKTNVCCGCRCSKLAVSFLVIIILLIAALAAVIAILAVKGAGKELQQPQHTAISVCVTSSCVSSAAAILNDGNLTSDPCDDFVQFACGKWLENTDIPASMPQFHRRFEIKERLTLEINDLVRKPIGNEPEAVKKAKLFYQSCLDVKTIEKLGKEPIWDIIKDLGGWPMVDDSWSVTSFSLEENIAKAYHHGQAPFIHAITSTDTDDPLRAMLHIGQPQEGPEFFLDRQSRNLVAYQDYLAAVGMELGLPQNTARERAINLVDFEVEMAKIMNPNADLAQEGKVPEMRLSVASLNQTVSQDINWMLFLNTLLQPVAVTYDSNNVVILQGKNYFKNLSMLIRATPPEVLQNYIVWKTLKPLLVHLPIDGIEQATSEYNQKVLGTEPSKTRWEACVKQTKFDETYSAKDYGLAVSRLWLPKYFDSSSKDIVAEMVEDLREAMVSVLKESDWLQRKTRDYAIEKAKAVTLQLGYPDWLYDDVKLDDYYSVFQSEGKKYLKNLAWMFAGGVLANLRKLKEKPGPNVWPADFPPTDADAGFNAELNMIVFPAGILQPPYFHKHYTPEMNYGAMGFVIGHELTHGFDTYGRHYDKSGYKRNWWTDEDSNNFKERAACFSDQYSDFVIPEANGEHIDGDLTLGENIADNGGLKVAFRAYNMYAKKHGRKLQTLPGLDLNQQQLFYLSAARGFCGKIRPEHYKVFLSSDPHSPEVYRIKGITENSKDFASVYGCSSTSRQNPEKKCAVW